ncbi:MAG: mannonate dehydratase [Gemmobacter sp.]
MAARNAEIRAGGFDGMVVESLPIHERIRRGEGDLAPLFANYRQSMANLAAEGITTICYNVMPLLDCTRADLAAPVTRGGTCLRFPAPRMAAFEIHMLGRGDAEADDPPEALQAAAIWDQQATEADREHLLHSIMSGPPGAHARHDSAGLRTALRSCEGLSAHDPRANCQRFLDEVIPAADAFGMRMAVHPDDPPRDIPGLPRIVSGAADLNGTMSAQDCPANGLILCTGSLGANPTNDLPGMARTHASRIHFAHRRNVRKDPDGSFEDAAHLEGDTDMVAVIAALLQGTKGRAIPLRPDHGHELLDDAARGTHPGYPLVGRLRGLAEMRGVIAALSLPGALRLD